MTTSRPASPKAKSSSGRVNTSDAVLRDLWRQAGLAPYAPGAIVFSGNDPVLPSSFPIGTAAQATIGAVALAAAEVWRRRTARTQRVKVDARHAAIEFRSEQYLRVDGAPAPEHTDRIFGTYRCGDGRWVRLHTNFPHLRDGVLRLLGCAHDREAVAAALQNWEAKAFEARAAEAGLAVTAMRSFAEWDAHPQGRAVATLPAVSVERIGDAPPAPLPQVGMRPLTGVRVLDLTRVIAGPVCGRALAAHGADVLLITAPHLHAVPGLVIDTGRAKLSAQLDLRAEDGRAKLRNLVAGADIFVQSYRPGALARLGFAPEELAALRPGIVFVTLSAYGHLGPWSARRGFDSLVQTASGFNHAEAEAAGLAGRPKPLPCQVLDHASGYLLAFGALAALLRRAEEGGSWLVRVALAGTGRWLRGLGRVERGFNCADPKQDEVADLLETQPSGFGALTAVRHAAQISTTPTRWARPSVPLGTHPAEWPGVSESN
jgi:crotonobetainyl-CoA:carnitine CoA-transferase CaiB-like acyl-CoA transferase